MDWWNINKHHNDTCDYYNKTQTSSEHVLSPPKSPSPLSVREDRESILCRTQTSQCSLDKRDHHKLNFAFSNCTVPSQAHVPAQTSWWHLSLVLTFFNDSYHNSTLWQKLGRDLETGHSNRNLDIASPDTRSFLEERFADNAGSG